MNAEALSIAGEKKHRQTAAKLAIACVAACAKDLSQSKMQMQLDTTMLALELASAPQVAMPSMAASNSL